mgnify:CR=1 FL=1
MWTASANKKRNNYLGGIILNIQLVKGTKDLYGSEVLLWQQLEIGQKTLNFVHTILSLF